MKCAFFGIDYDDDENEMETCSFKMNKSGECYFYGDSVICCFCNQKVDEELLIDIGFKEIHPEPHKIYSFHNKFYFHFSDLSNKINKNVADITMSRSEFFKRFMDVISTAWDVDFKLTK